MKRVLTLALLLTLFVVGEAQSAALKTLAAGQLRYQEGCLPQSETGFCLERVRVGEFNWFPSLLVLTENVPEPEARSLLGQDVLVFGDYTCIPVDSSLDLPIGCWSGVIVEWMIPVENRKDVVFSLIELPDILNVEETSIRFRVRNPLPHDLHNAELFIDLDGHFQFKGGKFNQYTTHSKVIAGDFSANEEKEFAFALTPCDLHRLKGHFGVSLMFLGYRAEDGAIEPVYAFWKREWLGVFKGLPITR